MLSEASSALHNALQPSAMLLSPEVIHLPAHCPNNTLSVAPEKLHAEQVLDANKLRSLSAENPPALIPVKFDPSP